MPTLVLLEYAKTHLRVDTSDEDQLITGQLAAAESISMSWIRRKVFSTQAELEAAVSGVGAGLDAAAVTRDAALAAAEALSNPDARASAVAGADEAYQSAIAEAKLIRRGVVLNDQFRSAVLITLGALYEGRQISDPPQVAQWLLDPLRAYG